MQNIIIDQPYRFVPPKPGSFWPRVMRLVLPAYLNRSHGIESYELFGVDRLRSSVDAGHGILLTPNHCRPCDPMVVGLLSERIGRPLNTIASWHLFMQNRLLTWILPRMGAFSIYREGMDREALKCAIQILAEARRPLVLFPEGVITRTNDRLNNLMDGTAFIAHSAAKQRAAMNPPAKVVVHPVAIRYSFRGDIAKALAPVLEDIERRLTWRPLCNQPLLDRIAKVGLALLTLKEMEYFGEQQTGTLRQRLDGLINRLLAPLEQEWLKGKREGETTARIKIIRTAILPNMVAGDITEEERVRRWEQLADTYLAQQIAFYPPEYFGDHTTADQMLETVERYEEDITDKVNIHRPLHAAVEVGEAIAVSPTRERGVEVDPVMAQIRTQLEAMLARMKTTQPVGVPGQQGPS
ncbi:MAG: 1-acyl-sn-glycerol-3-phosphate acyltransferase [Verrucomicrobia bacterium]|nr:1-acyl-sn-glycerol-3-phosphate acyltransferase [Verrucomicrobiota bacterium]